MRAKFSIRYKFLAVTTALLVVCVGVYLAIATDEFKNDKRSLVFDYNKSLVVNTASDMESFFTSLGDKMRLVALFYREPEAKRQLLIADLMREKQDLVFIAGSERFTDLNQVFYMDPEFLKTYGLEEKIWQQELIGARKPPLQKIQLEGEAIWNATLPGGPALIGFGKAVVEEDSRGVPVHQFAVVGFVKADRLIKALLEGRPNEVFVTTKDGDVLAHPNSEVMNLSTPLVHSRLLEIARQGPARKQVVDYVDGSDRFLGAYAYAFQDRILVMSRVSEKRAFRAVNRLIFRSLLFASLIVTLAFLVAIFFSRSITHPLDVLMKGMSRVSEGDLTGQIQVRSKDEISLLASSFNRMIQDLKKSREELEQINRELEDKVRARTRDLELQNRAVKEAQEALLRTTRLAAVGEVAGQAAHEVLNPLTSIISRLNKLKDRVSLERSREAQVLLDINQGWSQDFAEGGFPKLLQSWNSPSNVKSGASLWDEDLENIKAIGQNVIDEYKSLTQDTEFLLNEAERIGRIVNTFRTLNTHRGELKDASIHKLSDQSVKIMADLAERDNIRIEMNWRAKDDRVLVDEDEFIQVMTNLLRNAVQSVREKHGSSGQGQIRLWTDGKGDNIEIHIVDNGPGIVLQNRARLFEKNFTTKSKSEGTGIGLSISRRLIRAFQGDLTLFESENDPQISGAHFVITLPLSKPQGERGVA